MGQDSPSSDRPALPWTPWFVLVLALALTGAATLYVSATTRQTEELRFGRWVRQSLNNLKEHLDTHIAVLRGTAAFMSAGDEATRDEFHDFAVRLRLAETYPGMQGIGYTARILPWERAEVEARMSEQGAVDFRVWPEGERPEYHSILFLEPEDRRNLRAIGYDMFTEPTRREAMERARDTGMPAATGRVTLVQEIDPRKQAGFLVYVPVYEGDAVPTTVEERREKLRGFAYAPFRAVDLLQHVFDEAARSLVTVAVYDTANPTDETFFFRTADGADDVYYSTQVDVTIAGRPWTLTFQSRPTFHRQMQSRVMVPFTLASGLLLSLLLFGVTLGQANRAAAGRTGGDGPSALRALRQSEDRLRLALNAADLFAYAVDLRTEEVRHIGEVRRMLGTDIPNTAAFLKRVHPDDHLQYERSVARAVAGEAPHELEYRVRDTAGQTHWLRDRAVVEFDANGTALRLTGGCAEITRQKETEHMLRQLNETLEQRVADRTLEAEQRSAQLRALAAELTQAEQRERRRLAQVLHDHLQQLLVASLMRIGGARCKADTSTGEALDQVEDLVRQAINASRSLTIELSPPVLYDAGLGRALEWLARSMKEKHQLSVDLAYRPDQPAVGDDLRAFLFQAVRELLFNVVKHAGVREARVTMTHDDRFLRITVADGGPGFDPSTLGAAGPKAEHFGLFSIQQRLELLGGRMTVESAAGEGTQITLEAPIDVDQHATPHVSQILGDLPESDEHAYAEKLLSSYMTSGDAVKVLLADDHEVLRQGLGAILHAQSDIELVGEASDGEEVVQLAAELKPDVVVMDVSMPRADGVEATRRILEAAPNVRVIGLSMYENDGMASAMKAAGAYAYAHKSGPAEHLLDLIRAKPQSVGREA